MRRTIKIKYTLQFLTEKGEQAYKEIKAQPISLKEKMIVNKIFKEKQVKDNPVTIEIDVKIPWLAVQEQIDNKIIQQMGNKLCERDLDYTLEVSM